MAFIALVVAIVAVFIALTGRRRSDDALRDLAERVAALEAARVSRASESTPAAAVEQGNRALAAMAGATAAEAPKRPPEPATPAPHMAPPVPLAPNSESGFAGIEERLIRRWIVWLGALALAFGVVFLVKYSIERGFFGPAARIAAGTLISLALVVAGEWTRRHPPALPEGVVQPDQVPPGLSAAGVVGLFASFLAGYALYSLYPPLPAFALLAGVSVATALLSLLHGKYMALLGFVGAYVVPALVTTPNPTAAGLLIYVLLVTGGALMLLRWQGWTWLGWAVAAGAIVWAWMAFLLADYERALGIYLILVPALFVLLIPPDRTSPSRPAFVWTLALVDAVLMLALVASSGYSDAAIAFTATLALLLAGLGIDDPGYDRLAWIGGGLALAALAVWMFKPLPLAYTPSSYFTAEPAPILRFHLGVALAAALVYGGGGGIVLLHAPRPARWAFLSAAMPVSILAVVYWRETGFDRNLPWAALALILAAAYVLAADRLARRASPLDRAACVAAYAVAAVAAITLGMTMSLRLGWLSVALSLQLPAIAWIFDRTQVQALRKTALTLAAIVLVRLLLNPAIANYEIGPGAVFNALLYVYGVPWLAFLAATRWFRRGGEDALVRVLETGTVALFVALVSLEIRHGLNYTLTSVHYSLLEQGLHSSAWLAVALAMLARVKGKPHSIYDVAWRILAAVAAFNVICFSCGFSNPLLMAEAVGSRPLFNSLLFAYLVPGVLAAFFYRTFHSREMTFAANIAGVSALALGFIYLTLETRHLFTGEYLNTGNPADAEWYAYSAVWLLYGLALVVSGLTFGQPALRLAGFVIGAIVATKVFLFDMAALSGIYRAASFLGLGACLMGLGYLHQHMSGTAAMRGPAKSS